MTKITQVNKLIEYASGEKYSANELVLYGGFPAILRANTNQGATAVASSFLPITTPFINSIVISNGNNTHTLAYGRDNVISDTSTQTTGSVTFLLPVIQTGNKIKLCNLYNILSLASSVTFQSADGLGNFIIARNGGSTGNGNPYIDTRPSNNKVWEFVRTAIGWTVYEFFDITNIPSDRLLISNPVNTLGTVAFNNTATSARTITIPDTNINLGGVTNLTALSSTSGNTTSTIITSGTSCDIIISESAATITLPSYNANDNLIENTSIKIQTTTSGTITFNVNWSGQSVSTNGLYNLNGETGSVYSSLSITGASGATSTTLNYSRGDIFYIRFKKIGSTPNITFAAYVYRNAQNGVYSDNFKINKALTGGIATSFNSTNITASRIVTLANKDIDLGTISSVATTDGNSLNGTRSRIIGGNNNTASGADNIYIGCSNVTAPGHTKCTFSNLQATNTTFGTLPSLPATNNVTFTGWVNSIIRGVWFAPGYEVNGSKENVYSDLLTYTVCSASCNIQLTAKTLGVAAATLKSAVDGTSLPSSCHINAASVRTNTSHVLTLSGIRQGSVARSISRWNIKCSYDVLSGAPSGQVVEQIGTTLGFSPTVTISNGGLVSGGTSYNINISVQDAGAGSDNTIWTAQLETVATYSYVSF